jgi:hypothetical protein
MEREIKDEIGQILEPYINQVVGSTPWSVAEAVKRANLAGQKIKGMQLIVASIFAASVNKPTLESFLAKPAMDTIRPVLMNELSINGKVNMTALTLLGHSMLTSGFLTGINYIDQLKKKLGQDNIWVGSLDGGSISDKQRAILKEKKGVANIEDARLLASGLLKYTGIVSDSMTSEEMALWGENTPETSAGKKATSPSGHSRIPSTSFSSSKYAPSPSKVSLAKISSSGSRSKTYEIPEDLLNYRRIIIGQTDSDIIKSIERSGVEDFISRTRELMARDPDGIESRSSGTIR